MAVKLFPMRRGRALGGAVIVVALWNAGRCAAQSHDGAVPAELQVIAAACRENTARIESLQLSGTITATGARFDRQWDPIANQTYTSQTREFSVWKDVLNCRFDMTANRQVNETGEVIYNIPYAEHITSYGKLEREGGITELKRKYGTPQSTMRTIVTPAEAYEYRPERNQLEVNVDLRELTALNEEQIGLRLSFNRTLEGGTLAEFLDRWAQLAQRDERSIELIPEDGGQYRIRSTVTIAREGNATQCLTLDAVVDLDKGANALFHVRQIDGQVVETGRFDYINVGSAWLVSHAEIAGMFGPDGVPLVNAVYDVDAESVRINEPIDPQVFTFEALDVRKGALVVDHRTGEQYLYDDMPLHVKSALAAAREREEELGEAAARAPESPAPVPPPQPAPPPRKPGQAAAPAAPDPAPTPAQRAQATAAPADAAAPAAGGKHTPSPLDGRLPIPHGAASAETRPAQETNEAKVPETRPAPAETPVSTRPVATRPNATRPVRAIPAAEEQAPQPPAPPATGWSVVSPAVTGAVVGAGCVAALGIGLWKWRTGVRRPPGMER